MPRDETDWAMARYYEERDERKPIKQKKAADTINRDHYAADLAAFRDRINVYIVVGRKDNKAGHAQRKLQDLIAIRDQAAKLLDKWGDRL